MWEPSPEVKVRLFERIAREQRAAKRSLVAQRLVATALVVGLGSALVSTNEGDSIPVSPTPLTAVAEIPPIGIERVESAGHRLVVVEMGSLELVRR